MSNLVDRMFSDNNKITKVGLEKFAKGGYFAIKDLPPEFFIYHINVKELGIKDLSSIFFVCEVEQPRDRPDKAVPIKYWAYFPVQMRYFGKLEDNHIKRLKKFEEAIRIHTSYIWDHGYFLDQGNFRDIEKFYQKRFFNYIVYYSYKFLDLIRHI